MNKQDRKDLKRFEDKVDQINEKLEKQKETSIKSFILNFGIIYIILGLTVLITVIPQFGTPAFLIVTLVIGTIFVAFSNFIGHHLYKSMVKQKEKEN